MPLPIVVTRMEGTTQHPHKINRHHPNFNQRRRELQTVAGRALRALRIQDVPVFVHDRFHDVFRQPDFSYLDTPIPGQAVFERIPLYHAGYVPMHGIDPFADDPANYVRLNPKRRALIGTDMHIDGKFDKEGRYNISESIGNFMFTFILDNFVDDAQIEDFDAAAHKPKKQARLARRIMFDAVHEAAALAHPMYKRARLDRRTTRMRHCLHASEVFMDLLDDAYKNHTAEEVFEHELHKRAAQLAA